MDAESSDFFKQSASMLWAGQDCGIASTDQPEDSGEHPVHREGRPGTASIQGASTWQPPADAG